MILHPCGQIVKEEWERSANIRKELILGPFVVMPNHIHGIVFIESINKTVGAHGGAPAVVQDEMVLNEGVMEERVIDERARRRKPLERPKRSIGSFVAAFKQASTSRINALYGERGGGLWQRNYHDHIIRSHESYLQIQEYIDKNPRRWEEDRFFRG